MNTPQYLTIPTTPETWIPLQMSEDDFGLMLATIDLWKSRIVATNEDTVALNPDRADER